MKKIILSIVFAGTMLIGNATPPSKVDCAELAAKLYEVTQGQISSKDMYDVIRACQRYNKSLQ